MWRILQRGPVVAVLVALVLGSWLVSPDPEGREAPPPPLDAWELPLVTGKAAGGTAATLAKAGLWGGVPEMAEGGTPRDPNWRFLGIVRSGKERFVMIMVEGQPEQRLKAGERLPGGSEILSIDDDSLCLLVNGRKRRLGIYTTGSQAL